MTIYCNAEIWSHFVALLYLKSALPDDAWLIMALRVKIAWAQFWCLYISDRSKVNSSKFHGGLAKCKVGSIKQKCVNYLRISLCAGDETIKLSIYSNNKEERAYTQSVKFISIMNRQCVRGFCMWTLKCTGLFCTFHIPSSITHIKKVII